LPPVIRIFLSASLPIVVTPLDLSMPATRSEISELNMAVSLGTFRFTDLPGLEVIRTRECSYPGSCACYPAVPLVMLIKNILRGAAAGAAH
jgi:hypothetical protein